METDTKTTETFRKYAEERLEIHQRELATRYQDRALASADLKVEALQAQRGIFEKELSEKVQEISQKSDDPVRPSLELLKNEYVEKLESTNSPV
ncbi:hypothetical protein [Persicitalea jodogahamensis]|uniref:Uncharacterized protein n=1 Tax=Persicitalea jodogahamensis TaxID=402147 RepID=A0A8J3DDM5_9BACT|nr:hypothetical protein [Persicitalea jodogahamensis]GHB87616.1 hypothetical protein GCM10007390_49460 [Persicitalea jodogahamensis]